VNSELPVQERTRSVSTHPVLEVEGVGKRYGDATAVREVSLTVPEGELLTLLGPSGSGKTTLLKLVAGFTDITSGRILLRGRDISELSPAERGIGMVFQNYALFPHMTVQDNVGYGLKMLKRPAAERERRVAEMLDLVGLPQMGQRLPRELSGGQQQRVALARALAFGPSLLLMDEPLGALDRELRERMMVEIRRIHQEVGVTALYVTHDREEALTLSDRIAIMRDGVLEGVGTPAELLTVPPSRFIASFFGGHTILPARRGASGTGTVEWRRRPRPAARWGSSFRWPRCRPARRLVLRPPWPST
jgi:ABC-type Fe3+/spermidine/putrescine transport system ATPase subunit